MAKISVNQLAKYLASNSSQHRSIIQKQIEQKPFVVNYYDHAQRAIQSFLLDPSQDEEILVQAIENIARMVPKDENEETKFDNNIEALNSFLRCIDDIQLLDNPRIFAVANSCPKVVINDVEISVYPNCIISGEYRSNNVVGAIKLYFGKNDPLTQNMGSHITTLMKRYLEENHSNDGGVRNQICQVIDVFGCSIFSAPTAYVTRMKEISAACEEIIFWWNSLQPNASPNGE